MQDRQDKLLNRAQPGADRVEYPDSVPAVFQPTGTLKEGNLSRHGGLRKLQDSYKVTDTELSLAQQQTQDAQTAFVVQRLKDWTDGFHAPYISDISDMCKTIFQASTHV